MAVALEFIDFVIPIATIWAKYPGGWEQCLIDHRNLIGRRVWYDGHLLRDGAMNPDDIRHLVDEWTGLGFEPTAMVYGERVWGDVCVVESILGGPTLPCPWIEVDAANRCAFLKGQPAGEVIGRDNFKQSNT